MPWHQVRLSTQQVVDGEEGRILDLFADALVRARGDPDMAMFSSEEGEDTVLHFTPATDQLFLRMVRAQPSERPPQNATFMAGENETGRRFRAGQLPY